MIQKGFIAALLVLSAGFCAAQQTTPPTPPVVDPNGPVMSFKTTDHDFGTIEQDDNGTFLFLFTNTGKEPLVIKEAHGSCGCTVPKWPHGPVNPGQQDTIKVTYDTHRPGAFSKTVTITSNAKESPDVLKITGKVLTKDSYPAFPTNNANTGGVPYTNTTDNTNQ